jgi:DNA-binding beta-propeller fold protein YncE
VLRGVPVAVCSLLCFAGPAHAAELQLVDEFGSRGAGPGQFANVSDLEVAPGGNLVVSDSGNERIQIFTPNGTLVRAFGSSGSGPGQFFSTAGVAIRGDGTIFVDDAGNGRVEVFTAAGVFVRQFQTPRLSYAGAALDPAEASIYLVDYQAGNIQRLSITGANMGLLGSYGTGNGQFLRPFGIAVDSSGNLYVADRDNNRVEKLNSSGAFLARLGGLGSGPGQMRGPLDVAIGADGNVLVADTGNFRLQEFTPAGQLVASYDRVAGSPTPTFSPDAVTAAPSGDIYLVDNRTERILRVRAGPAPPTLGRAANVAEVSGAVFVNTPGAGGFVPLEQARRIPVGSVLDARRGTVRLTTARDRQGHTQTGRFDGGIFKFLQERQSGGLTELLLRGGDFGPCRAAKPGASASLTRRQIRRLRARASGRFRTRGRYSASTVRGTVWNTIDRCDGTLTSVQNGSVVVRDLPRRRNVVVRAGRSYLARAPGA